MRRKNDGEITGHDANQVSDLSAGRRLGTVLKFPRRTEAAASEGSAGCSETSSGHPPFTSLGSAVSAVVLRVGNSRLRVQALVPSTVGAGGKDGTRDDGSMGE
jgi:hypothetical protein